jgi:hypothetical protein
MAISRFASQGGEKLISIHPRHFDIEKHYTGQCLSLQHFQSVQSIASRRDRPAVP